VSTHVHLEEFLQRDLAAVERKLGDMARAVNRALSACLQALVRNDRQRAYSVILRDQYIDEQETELDRLCLEFLVRHQPVAGHLRFIFATIQINRELERVGDFAESVARQALAISRLEGKPDFAPFVELAELTQHMLEDSIQAFLNRDADLARRSMVIEERANTMRNNLNTEISRMRSVGMIPGLMVQPLQTIARRFEGVSDQAKHICEEVLYMCTGEFTRHRDSEFKILFLGKTNSGLSQMAEAIGKSLRLSRFVFSSAGLSARPIDQRILDFLRTKGIDTGSLASKTLDQVPGWDQYHVVITLGIDLPQRLPDNSKAIHIGWNVAQEPEAGASGEQGESQISAAYNILETQIKELVGAVVEDHPPQWQETLRK
jgi:phosphate transport system protein